MISLNQLVSMHLRDGLMELLVKMEREDRSLPTIGPVKASLLYLIVSIVKPSRILELGTLHGYSALVMLKACLDLGLKPRLITVERDPSRAARALKNFKRAGVEPLVQLVIDDAIRYLMRLNGIKFDLAFIDINKNQYPAAYKLCLPIIRKGGIMIFDNALMPSVERFSKEIMRDTQVIAVLVGISDGMLICIKR